MTGSTPYVRQCLLPRPAWIKNVCHGTECQKVKSDQPRPHPHRLIQRSRRKDFTTTIRCNPDSDIPRRIVNFSAANGLHPSLSVLEGFENYSLNENLDALPTPSPLPCLRGSRQLMIRSRGQKLIPLLNPIAVFYRPIPPPAGIHLLLFAGLPLQTVGIFTACEALVAPFPLLSACTAMQRREEPPPPGPCGLFVKSVPVGGAPRHHHGVTGV